MYFNELSMGVTPTPRTLITPVDLDTFEADAWDRQIIAPCTHPAHRLHAWHVYDNTLVVCCCDCGAVLQGGEDVQL